ncbi:MAG: hypothetical protein ACFFD4_15350, partial [Candidatus Odinarchaeota archaeon]
MESAVDTIYVLHVDDDEFTLDTTKLYLEDLYGDWMKIATISHPAQVVEKLQDDMYDVIVSDYQMP